MQECGLLLQEAFQMPQIPKYRNAEIILRQAYPNWGTPDVGMQRQKGPNAETWGTVVSRFIT